VTRRLKKLPNCSKNSQKSCQIKKGQNIFNKAQFESPKHCQVKKGQNIYNKAQFESQKHRQVKKGQKNLQQSSI
jgi:hypothetical protein